MSIDCAVREITPIRYIVCVIYIMVLCVICFGNEVLYYALWFSYDSNIVLWFLGSILSTLRFYGK
jgi:hypothetical protein